MTPPDPSRLTAGTLFVAIVLVTLGITVWASRRARSTGEFYAAGGRLSPLQNGLAIAGDFMSNWRRPRTRG